MGAYYWLHDSPPLEVTDVPHTRREFIHRTGLAAGAILFGGKAMAARLAALAPLIENSLATDTVSLGKTGIQTSRLAMGTGTVGSGGHSHQTALGVDGLSRLLLNGYDNGLRFFDAADSYGSHPHVAEDAKARGPQQGHRPDKIVGREMLRACARTLTDSGANLAPTTSDIVLMHCVTEADWTTRYRGAMDVLSDAKQKGIIRAHGCSCHSIEALRAAANSPWVEVDLARMNPVGAHMDADPETVAACSATDACFGQSRCGHENSWSGSTADETG